MRIEQAVEKLIDGNNLSRDEMTAVMRQLMTGNATEAQIGGFLVALRIKGETVTEITAAASVMRELVIKVQVEHGQHVDIVGTGGDSAGIFNVSTAASIVAAAGGVTIAKHGNRSASSTTGSADVLEAAGINFALNKAQVERCIHDVGIGFMFAPNFHPAMKYAVGARRELKIRTIFNLLGPLTNPAFANRLMLGVFSRHWQHPFAEALRSLGAEHVLVVHSADGLDEISIAAATHIVELKGGEISEYTLTPADVGLQQQALNKLQVSSAAQSLALIQAAYKGEAAAAADMIALNAGAAFYVAGTVGCIADGVTLAHDVMASGQAQEKLANWAAYTGAL